MLLPDRVQGAALDLGDLDAFGWQWAATLGTLSEAEALLLLRAWLLWVARARQDAQHAIRVTEAWNMASASAPNPRPSSPPWSPGLGTTKVPANPHSPLGSLASRFLARMTDTFRAYVGACGQRGNEGPLGAQCGHDRALPHTPTTPKFLHMGTVSGQLCPGRQQPYLGLLHTLNGLCVLLWAGAKHLQREDRCEGLSDPQSESGHHPGDLRYGPSQGCLTINVAGCGEHT